MRSSDQAGESSSETWSGTTPLIRGAPDAVETSYRMDHDEIEGVRLVFEVVSVARTTTLEVGKGLTSCPVTTPVHVTPPSRDKSYTSPVDAGMEWFARNCRHATSGSAGRNGVVRI